MNPNALQRLVDDLRATSAQWWALRTTSVLVAMAASVVTGAGADAFGFWIVIFVGASAVGAVARPESHLGLVTVALVAAQWLVVANDVATAWAVPVGCLLFVFHAVVALLAAGPHTASIPGCVLRRWVYRTGVIAAAVAAMWALVAAFEQRTASGSVVLTFLALATLFGWTLAARRSALG